MAHVILGLLMLWPQSLYELTKHFAAGISLFYSASTGSIKRALDRLIEDEYIAVASEHGPRGKKTYEVTATGREEFRRWMFAELTSTDFEAAILPRAYFLGLVAADERPAVAVRIRDRIRQDLRDLERLEAQVTDQDVPEGYEDIAKFQLATLQYGLASGRTALAWAEEYLPD